MSVQPVNRARIRSVLLKLSIVLVVLFCLAPILWQLLTSFKVNADISAVPNVFFPKRLTLSHYAELFARRPLWKKHVGHR